MRVLIFGCANTGKTALAQLLSQECRLGYSTDKNVQKENVVIDAGSLTVQEAKDVPANIKLVFFTPGTEWEQTAKEIDFPVLAVTSAEQYPDIVEQIKFFLKANTYPLSTFERIHIVDGFYTDPEFIRNLCLSLEKEKTSAGNYAGIMTEQSFFTNEHKETLSALLGHPVKPGTQLTGKIRFTKEGDVYKQDIHFDFGDNLAWAGVCYLSPEYPEGQEGTIFWKHKRTGLEAIPRTLEGIQQYGWNDVNDLKHFLDTDGVDHSLWEKTMVVPYKFNRLVLFRPWMFHSPGPAFGNTLETARVVQTIFLSPDDN